MNYGKKKKMAMGGMAKKKEMKDGGMNEEKFMEKLKEAQKKRMKEAQKKRQIIPNKMAMGGKVMKDVPMDKKKSLGKLPTEVRNKMGFKKAGGKVKMMKEGGLTKAERDFVATAFQPKTPKERKAAAIDKVKRENKSQSNQERKKESSRKLKAAHKRFEKKHPLGSKMPSGGKKAGGMIKKKKKMAMGGMAMKYKHGGKVGKKCPRDGIAMKGKTRA